MGEVIHLVDGRRTWWLADAPPDDLGTPDAPAHLTAQERAAWDELIAAMEPVHILAPVHVWFLELFVSVWCRWQAMPHGLDRDPELVALEDQTEDLVYELLQKLGLPDIVAERLVRFRCLPPPAAWWRWIADAHHRAHAS